MTHNLHRASSKATKPAYPSLMTSTFMIKPFLPAAFIIGISTIGAQAAILSNDSERRIEVRHAAVGSDNISGNAYITPSASTAYSAGVTIHSGTGSDSMQSLITQKQRQYELDAKLSIEENKRVITNKRSAPNHNTRYSTASNTYNQPYDSGFGSRYGRSEQMDFNGWLNSSTYRAQQVASYQRYLAGQVGAHNVPPLDQLLTTARSWDKCGYEPYQLPPQELWSNIVPTLRLYSRLKSQGVLPASTEIRSVYRSPGLNDCAGGASASKHMTAGAIDIWVPEYDYDEWRLSRMQDALCQYWQYQGESDNFGLGLYATGAIHLDTQGYRKWGFNHASSSSSCRY